MSRACAADGANPSSMLPNRAVSLSQGPVMDGSRSTEGMRRIRLRVRRTAPDRWQVFDVAYEDGETALDALCRLRESVDPALAVRFACRCGACKTCAARIDGRNGYLCMHRLNGPSLDIEPLAGRRLIRDLVVDLGPDGRN